MGSNTTSARTAAPWRARGTHLGTHLGTYLGVQRRVLAAAVLASAALLSQACGGNDPGPGAQDTAAPTPVSAGSSGPPGFYTTNVVPILRTNCYRCHGPTNHRGGLKLDTPGGILRGGRDGAVLLPGDPEHSLLIRLIRHEGPADDPMPMPPRSKLSDADISTMAAWIQAGAKMP